MNIGDTADIVLTLAPGLLTLIVARFFAPSEKEWDGVATLVYGLGYTVFAQMLSEVFYAVYPWLPACLSRLVIPTPPYLAAQIAGVCLGVAVAFCARVNLRYRILRWFGIQDAETVWIGAFSEFRDSFVVLYFNDGRRLMGKMRATSHDSEHGHILMGEAHYIENDGKVEITKRTLLIPASDIRLVEFV